MAAAALIFLVVLIVLGGGFFLGRGRSVSSASTAANPTPLGTNLLATALAQPTQAKPAGQATPATTPAAAVLTPGAGAKKSYSALPEMKIDPKKHYSATIKTSKGDIVADLFADKTPKTVNNLVFLSREGFYDGTPFHRVLENFMAQGGDPTGTGTGGPGYKFEDEFSPDLKFDGPGYLAMANSGPGTNGSQFFITFAATEWLNGKHTIFGKVTQGMDILAKLTRVDPTKPGQPQPDTIKTITIEEK
ncbi:MAG: peptidylprolyl isomerase [Chloroflexi bacterium]|nr:peptidylprolyl isomerase [Chloroflexota bacterium]